MKGKHSPIQYHMRLSLQRRVPDGHKPHHVKNQGDEEASRQTSRFHTSVRFDEGGGSGVRARTVMYALPYLENGWFQLVPYRRQGGVL